jgi:hypothetical protein|tara:strand:- start:47 stop:322 length:276 start_codon:yes stop_codon:yes gene_type:complete
MSLNEYLNSNGFTTDNLELLPSVGCVINTKTGDTFPIMDDDTIDFESPMCVVEMWNDQFNSQEWFDSLHTCDKPVVNKVLMDLLPSKVKII